MRVNKANTTLLRNDGKPLSLTEVAKQLAKTGRADWKMKDWQKWLKEVQNAK